MRPRRACFETTGCHNTSVFEQLRYAARRLMVELYAGILLPSYPVSKLTPKKQTRNAEIRARHRAGASLSTLAETFGISEQRIHQIVQGRRR
jgi:Mor family transcriptional regulator